MTERRRTPLTAVTVTQVLGRDRELAELRALVEATRSGHSKVLVVHGPAGAGKSALLDELATSSRCSGLRVLRASGVRSESNVAWSGLSELLLPVADELRHLPAVHGSPLAAALALGPPAESDRHVIGVATLSLLARLASDTPVVAIVDDVQWLDQASSEAILFAGRRLAAEGVALVLARREGLESDPHGLDLHWAEHLAVEPLGDDHALALLQERARGQLAPAVARRLVEAAAGNALALVGVPRLLTDDQRRGRAPLPDPLPVPESFERELTAHLQRLPLLTRRALTVAAAHSGPDAGPVSRALATLGLDERDLADAEADGVLRLGGGVIAFEHPLMRSAAYHSARPSDRRDAHAALAEALETSTSREARARHLAAAAVGPDDTVADSLEAAAGQARERSAVTVAADLMLRAALLSEDPRDRARRRIRAAELALRGGATGQAGDLLDEVGSLDDPVLRSGAAHVRGRLAALTGGSRAAVGGLVQAATATRPADPKAAALLMAQAAAVALVSGRHSEAAEHAAEAVALADGDEPLASLAELAACAARVVAGDAADGDTILSLYRSIAARDDVLAVAHPTLLAAVSALVWLEDFDRAEELIDAVVGRARQRSDLEILPLALVNRGWVLFRRPRVTAGIAAATEALELADATGQRPVGLVARQLLAHLASFAGRFDEARALAGEVLAATEGGPLTPVRYNAVLAMAGAEQSMGRHHISVELLERVVDRSSSTPFFRNPAAFGGVFPLIEGYARLGRVDEARELLGSIERLVAERDQAWPKGQVARLRGLLDADYDRHFADARDLMAHVGAAQVVTFVDWAERLQSDGRHDEARAHLMEAFAIARRTGYHGRTAAIVSGLARLGERVVVAPDEVFRLTGQELAVAMSVASGASVTDAAAELFLSPQTVERELAEACRKLGAATPADLASRLEGDQSVRPGCVIRVLGSWEVRREGAAVPAPAGRAGTVVQLLSSLGGRLPVDEVIEHLWPDAEPGAGRVRLRNVLSRVRSSLGDCVRRQGDVLALAEDVSVDAAAFEEAARAALSAATKAPADAVALAEQAVGLYRGPLLPAAAYEPWADAPRERLHRLYLELLDLLADRMANEGRWDDAARFLELAIEADPHDHDRYVVAAEVRMRQGRRSSALHLCRQARERAAELGVPPPAGLVALERTAAPSG